MTQLARVRRIFNQALPAPGGADIKPAVVAGVAGEWVRATRGASGSSQRPPRGVLLYLHGGGFIGCSPVTHRPITVAFALRGWQVFVPDYRLAPEHPFPAAIDDAVAVWRELVARHADERLAVAGDSAGGNLSLALMLHEKSAGRTLPTAAALFSPSTDMTGGSPSLRTNERRDAMFDGKGFKHLADVYLQGGDPSNPLVSPLLGDLRGLPPILLHVGADEVLRDDSLRFAERARGAGVTVRAQIWPIVPHVWQLLWRLPEAKRSIEQASDFMSEARPWSATHPEDLDVVIVGAGLSGIGAAAMLQHACPDQHVAVLESRDRLGGTWDLFRYPGMRSDSDMHTMGYRFKPWTGSATMATGEEILDYVTQTATERGIHYLVRYGHKLVSADWSDTLARWTLTIEIQGSASQDLASGDHHDVQRVTVRCRILHLCAGYYRYDTGYRPTFHDEAHYLGEIVHPQFWPQHLDVAGKRIIVIGSGATAVTLVPALAESASHVTMLQRTPSYVVSLPSRDRWAGRLKTWLPSTVSYSLVRTKNILSDILFFILCRTMPKTLGQWLAQEAARQIGSPEMAPHFLPDYGPWTQRLCVVPDGDLFKALREGRASIVTDRIDRFTPSGIRLKSGEELAADIIVTATGLELQLLGGVALSVNGQAMDTSSGLLYRGLMLNRIPNLTTTFGYTNASWTLRADLTASFLCRLVQDMQRYGLDRVMPVADDHIESRPMIDFSSGYVKRAESILPKQGQRAPWRVYQNYLLDYLMISTAHIHDGVLHLRKAKRADDQG